MKELTLKLNYFLFRWYYNRVPEHFKSWTFFESVKILISNYNHSEFRNNQKDEMLKEWGNRLDSQDKELRNLKMMMAGHDPKLVNKLNNMFGTNLPSSKSN